MRREPVQHRHAGPLHVHGHRPRRGRERDRRHPQLQRRRLHDRDADRRRDRPGDAGLTLGPPASFGTFLPGVANEYTATTTANVVSTAGIAKLSAALTVSDPGHLANGAFTLPQPLRVEIAPNTWSGPVSNATSTITFRQAIGRTDAVRTGTYSRTLTFTLSTTTP